MQFPQTLDYFSVLEIEIMTIIYLFLNYLSLRNIILCNLET